MPPVPSVPLLSRPWFLPVLLLVHALVHFALGWVLGLSGDEAHYALYAAHPALSYYDHPPLVGWMQWPLVALGAPDGVLRLVPQALWLGTAGLLYATTRQLYARLSEQRGADTAAARATVTPAAEHAALWAVLAYSLSPLLHVLGIGLLPDTLLMFFTAAIVWQTLRLFDPAQVPQLRAWLLLGGLLGLAGLAKYTAIFAAVPVLLCLLAVHGMGLLRRAAPWLALLLAVVLVLPVFIWNAQHDWISFAYQLHHGAGSHWQGRALLAFLLTQLVLYPLLVWSLRGLRQRTGNGLRWGHAAWLWSFFALPFGVLAWLSGGGSSLPHWTAPAWVALLPWVGIGLAALWQHGRRRLVGVLAVWQGVLCVGLYGLMLMAGPPSLSSPEPAGDQPAQETLNPFTDFYGWDQAGARARALAQQHQVPHLAVQNWTLASRLAWYARPLPVHVLAPGFDQFSLWTGELPRGASAVLMDWSQMAYRLPVGPGQFAQCVPLEQFAVPRAGRPVAHFALHLCSDWGGKPAPRRIDEP